MTPPLAAACWTDSHCHLQDFEDVETLTKRAVAAGVGRFVCIGTGVDSSKRAIGLAATSTAPEAVPIWATIGLHPHGADGGLADIAALAADVLTRPGPGAPEAPARVPGSVVAIGECGLDYHYDYADRGAQREVFAGQIALATDYGLPLVVHTREAWDDTLSILDACGTPEHLVIHCFTGGPDEARRCLDLGAYLSFSGIVTFKNASDVREALAICPIDRLLVETDAPYLAPVPHRGRQNEPAFVAIVGDAVARLIGRDPEDLAAVTSANAASVFALTV